MNTSTRLLQTVTALQDAYAYMEHAERLSQKKEYRPVRMEILGVIDEVVKLYTEERNEKR